MKVITLLFVLLSFSFAHAETKPTAKKDTSMNAGSAAAAGAMIGGAAGNAIAGIAFTSECSTTNKMSCVFAALSFAQAAADSKGAKESKSVGQQVGTADFDYGGFGSNGATVDDIYQNPDQLWQNLDQVDPVIQKGIDDLKKKGFAFNEETGQVDTPGGSMSGNMSDLEASMSPEDFEKAKKKIAEINSRMRAVKMKLAGGGGGRGRGPASASYESPDYANMFGQKRETPRAPKTAGLTRMAGGEPIGVKVDNLFHMIHRRYKAKRDENIFVKTAAPVKHKGR